MADGDEHRVARFEKMQPLPWAGEGERWRPNKRLLQIVLGAIRMKDATKDLLETFIDNHGDRQPAQGFAPIATITVVGRPSDEPAVAISSFGGSPTYKNLDVLKTSSPSIWSFQNILPPTLYALPLIEQVPVAAAFNPEKVAVLNTVVVSDVVVTKITESEALANILSIATAVTLLGLWHAWPWWRRAKRVTSSSLG